MKLRLGKLGAVLDSVCASSLADHDWAVAVREALGDLIDGDQRAIAVYRWDSATSTANMLAPLQSNTAALDEAWPALFGNFTPEEHRGTFCGPPVQTLRSTFRSTDAGPRKLAKATGESDWLMLTALDTDGHGEILGYGVPRRIALTRATTQVLENILAHLTAAARIRRMRGATDAVFAPSGRVLHAETRAQADLEPLRAMVKKAESARTRKSAPDEALAGWTAVVQGRWSLVDQFESDGRRFVVARENEPRASLRSAKPIAPLSRVERNALALLGRGHALKSIAYELGLSTPYITVVLSRARSKLGIRSRAELVHIARLALGVIENEGST
ncbi:MAG: helix-turn-helix transcriptional regulator [Polyangiaceae bacterium]